MDDWARDADPNGDGGEFSDHGAGKSQFSE